MSGEKTSSRKSLKTGMPPGSLVFTGKQKTDRLWIHLFDYTESHLAEQDFSSVQEVFARRSATAKSWIDLTGLHDTAAIQALGEHFEIHPLVLEDVLNTQQRPRMEELECGILLILKMISPHEKSLVSEQISLIVEKNYVLMFQEAPGDVFEPLRQRLRLGKGLLRKRGADYLFYAILDIIVDNYFILLEHFGEQIEQLEEEVLQGGREDFLPRLYRVRRDLLEIRRIVWPLREAVNQLQRNDSGFIETRNMRYINDLYDHVIQVIDSVEVQREMVASLIDLHYSAVSNRMNEVMKTLTIISTIFIPLSFLAGVYGMNFDTSASALNMPELSSRYGYLIFWLISIGIGSGLMVFFRRRNWW